jgi:hypothetical protein
MSEWSQALSAPATVEAEPLPTISGNRGLQIEEKLLFEQDSPGHCGVDFPEPSPFRSRLGGLERRAPIGLPGLSEPQVVRHFTRLSQKNYAIDAGLYPLGSCTMKHNPRLNEKLARLPGFADLHPLQPEATVPGAFELIDTVAHWLKTLTGMPALALSPAAGAQGELCGIMAIRAALEARGDPRSRLLVPESAHGTNPATAATCGYAIEAIPANSRGRVDLAAFKAKLGGDVAALMLTNPNTCGLFEDEILEIAEAVHGAGAFFYCDGANFNAIVGRVRPSELGIDALHLNLHKTFSTPHGGGGPGSGPVALAAELAPYAPLPWLVHGGNGFSLIEHAQGPAEHSIGRLKGFHGGAQRQLCSGWALRFAEPGVSRHLHARGAVRRRFPQGHRGHHPRFRQGADRRGVSPDDDVFSAGRARRLADRADRDREQSRSRPVRRGVARPRRARPGGRRRRLPRRAAPHPAPPARRDRGGEEAGAALAPRAGSATGGGVAPAKPHPCRIILQFLRAAALPIRQHIDF